MTSSKWCCTTPNNWVIFDCEGIFRFYGFGIWDCKAGPEDNENFNDYTIELSLDGENWTTVVDEYGRGSDDIKYDNIAPARGRYIRFSPKNTAVLRVWESEACAANRIIALSVNCPKLGPTPQKQNQSNCHQIKFFLLHLPHTHKPDYHMARNHLS